MNRTNTRVAVNNGIHASVSNRTMNYMKINKKKRNARRKMKMLVGVVIVLLLLFFGSSVVAANTTTELKEWNQEDYGNDIDSVQEHEKNTEGKRYKYYTTVYVKRNMTLWDIAEEYMTEEYSDKRAYIDEVMEINQLKSDKLSYGSTICVPYYSTEYK